MSVDAAAKRQTDLPPIADIERGPGGQLVLCLLAGYLLLIGACAVWLRAPRVMVGGEELSLPRAILLAASTATLTGFQQSIGFNDFNPDSVQGPTILILLTVAGSLLALIAGGLASVRTLRLPFSDKQVIAAALTAELLAVLLGVGALYPHHPEGGGEERFTLIDPVNQATCAFGNCGAVITGRYHYFPNFNSWLSQGVLLPLALLGGLGLPVLMELYHRVLGNHRRLSKHCLTTLTLAAGVYLAATLLLFLSMPKQPEPAIGAPLYSTHIDAIVISPRATFLVASATAINTRTAGLPYDVAMHLFLKHSQWLLMLLMIIGASPAGTGGGVKTTTFFVLFTGFANALRGRPVPRVFGIAGVWLAIYLVVAGISSILLADIAQISGENALFTTLSALSNVGLAYDPISIEGPGLFLLTLVMLIGRLAPIGILWWMAQTTQDAEILVG